MTRAMPSHEGVAGTLDKQARVLGSVVAVLWAVFLVNVILHGRLLSSASFRER